MTGALFGGTLALHGGEPVRRLPMPPRPPYGIEERNAVNTVLSSGNLSGFLGAPGEGFLGGPYVRRLEEAWCERFGVKHAVAMNSATSCLFGAVKATTDPQDEVVVAPWSMSASVACVREAGCSPVFTDVDPYTFGIAQIGGGYGTYRVSSAYGTYPRQLKAIVLVHLFGCPARWTMGWRDYARERGLVLIEDAAQAVGATWHGAAQKGPLPIGTFGAVGIFSLNRHKTIQCGEGGIAVTNSDTIAEFLRGYRNHGEVGGMNRKGYWGGNYRMGEIEAAIAEVQLGRLEELTEPRIENAGRLTEALWELDGICPPAPPAGLRHVYYLYPVQVPGWAEAWAKALTAEGIPASRYVEPLYRLPVFRGFALPHDAATFEEIYPVVESAYEHTVVIDHVHAGMTAKDVDDVIDAFRKVHEHREEL